jgi:hypothetical protein
MGENYTGGCMCGAIRYDIPGKRIFSNHCQCRTCQHLSGTGHGSYITFAGEGVVVTGAASRWEAVADSGNVKTHAFCPTCGSPVYLTFSMMPDLFTIHAASLDDPGRFKPDAVTYASRAWAWDTLDPAVPSFAQMPTGN